MSLPPGLGPLSNRASQYQQQHTLIVDKLGRLRYAPQSRRILALPLEILAEIFEHCLPDVEFIRPALTAAPLVLCSVCHQWREVAVSTPKLWGSLELRLELSEPKTYHQWEAYVYLYLTWLSRARRTPVSLSISLIKVLKSPHRVRPILQAIAQMSAQCRIIKFDPTLVDIHVLFPSDAFAHPRFPFLEKVTCTNHTQFTDLLPFANAPRVRELYTCSYPIALPTEFPWEQITLFTTHRATLSSCLSVLDRAVQLVDCNLRIALDDIDSFPTSVVSLDHLQSLSISAFSDVANVPAPKPMSILGHLKTPALKHLILRNDYSGHHLADFTSFFSWQLRSTAQLHVLVLSLIPVSGETLVACLKAVPTLVQLRLKLLHEIDMNPVFTQLMEANFLPKLEAMNCQLSIKAILDPTVLAKVLRWRWDGIGITRLRRFLILKRQDGDFYAAIRTELAALKDEGMQLYFGPSWDTVTHAL
ncbi:hypothetical protein R3P38DRAFT_539975 [Favolaschia claudopus]|uniref:F-box domain-containing protein n=1 Tax=Favolaschia claudopus TaxID=2862362 RepID=A0AAW0CIU5_9AGAR